MEYYPIYKNRVELLLKLGDYKILNEYEYFKDIIPKEEFKRIILDKQKRKNKRYRVDRKLLTMCRLINMFAIENIQARIVFGTLTLNDKVLSTKENTYIRKIHKYLKKHYQIAILNKDYGKTTEREHYHFIGLTIEPIIKIDKRSKTGRQLYQLKKQDYELGFEPDIEIVNLEEKKQTRNYLLKLNNHSTKDTTKSSRFRVIYNPICKFFLKDSKI